MKCLKIISDMDIESSKVYESINSEIQDKNYLYITATLNIKSIRSKKMGLEGLVTFQECSQEINKKVYEKKQFISTIQQKNIIKKILESFTTDKIAKAYLTMIHEVHELFEFLVFSGVDGIDASTLEEIEKNYSLAEMMLFKIYDYFVKIIDVLKDESKGNLLDKKGEAIYREIKRNWIDHNSDIPKEMFIEQIKKEITNKLKKYEVIIMDGFLFFNDLQEYLITQALKQEKKVCLVTKYDSSNMGHAYIFETYKKLAEMMGIQLKEPISNEAPIDKDTALGYLKYKYPEIDRKVDIQTMDKINDDSIQVFEPFENREEEIQFIVNKISEEIRNKCNDDIEKIEELVENKIAIVVAVEKEKYQNRISQEFKENGVFIYLNKKCEKNKEIEEIRKYNNINQVYYSRKEFLKINLYNSKGDPITYEVKNKFFHEQFKRIGIAKEPRPIAAYPVGQFILQIYKIIEQGMTIDGFKMFLYSNWDLNTNRTNKKWSKYVGEFKYIEVFLEDNRPIENWIEVFYTLAKIKYEIDENPFYRWHPVKNVSIKSLMFFESMLKRIKIILDKVNENRSVEEHVEILQNEVMQVNEVIKTDEGKLNFEQKIIKKLYSATEQISNDPIGSTIESLEFAEGLASMLREWERGQDSYDDNCLKLNVVNLENMKKFDTVFFMMLENTKYPRKLKYSFPFTKEILEIMNDKQYSFQKVPSSYKNIQEHLKLEKYLFQNVIEFTNQKLIISYTKKEDKTHNQPAIYIEDIATMFNRNVKDLYRQTNKSVSESTNAIEVNTPTKKTFKIKNLDQSKICEMAMYKLCPKVFWYRQNDNIYKLAYTSKFQLKFYYEAILYAEVLKRLVDYSIYYDKVYTIHNDEVYQIIYSFTKELSQEIKRYFFFLTGYEVKDAINKTLFKLNSIICNKTIGRKKDPIVQYRILKVNGQNDKVYYGINDIKIQGINTQQSKTARGFASDEYIDLLKKITKPTRSKLKMSTYKDVIEILDGEEDIDRVQAISGFNGLIYHLWNNNNDKLKLIEEIKKQEFTKCKDIPSGYCAYCLIEDVCKGNCYNRKEG